MGHVIQVQGKATFLKHPNPGLGRENMREEAKKQCMLMKIVSAPIKVLSKTTDLYGSCMGDCALQVGSGDAVFCPVPQMNLPRSFSVSSSSMRNDKDVRMKLQKSNSERRRPSSEVVGLNIHVQKHVKARKSTSNGMAMKRSLGKLGTIDEENPLLR
ncbi:hypothetical protein GH714_009762 [Hevea brasiliensis]|uniref:Uncharacterized protein n=1 Tax=Hevea brasiliensis TaxID=3981 RepID=A0A6A6KZ80_HEVBR|nr:hypothetical protein GH714_009762 [Hevea brasiliensis]